MGAFVVAGLSLLSPACAADDVEAVSVVERYVDLLDAGDFEGANALRCSGARIADADAEQFMNEIDRIRQSAGVPLEAVELGEVVGGTFEAADGSDVIREVRFRLRTTAGTSSPVHVAIVEENGQERLCGSTADVSVALGRQLLQAPVVASPTGLGDVRGLVERVEATFAGAAANGGVCPAPTSEPVVESWCTSWRTGGFGGVTVAVHRFADSTSAAVAASDRFQNRAHEATEIFDIAALPDAVALRHLASGWTLLQPADLGDQMDAVIAVFDDTVVFIGVSPTAASDDFAAVTEVAEFVAADVGSDD